MKIPARAPLTSPDRPVGAPPPAQAVSHAEAQKKLHDDPRLARACVEFEGVLVRQLLASSQTKAQEHSGYGSMVTDALAGAVSDGGGLGVADALRQALSRDR